LLAGALVDLASWRAVFIPSAAGAIAALALLGRNAPMELPSRTMPIPGVAIAGLIVLLGSLAYLLMSAPSAGLTASRLAWPISLALLGAVAMSRDPHRGVLFPRELLRARNCVPANAASFAFYFGMFGTSFLLVLYVQQVLEYSALRAALVLLPISIMLLLAERFGRLAATLGTRSVIAAGAVSAAAGIMWMGSSDHPLPFWSHLVAGTALFGLGLSLPVSALTHAAVAAVPDACGGAASGLNHAVVRAAGLVSIALLGSIAAPDLANRVSAEGVQRGLIVCAAVVIVGGVWSSLLLRDEEPGGLESTTEAAARAGLASRRHRT
jgi:hypothetical protein